MNKMDPSRRNRPMYKPYHCPYFNSPMYNPYYNHQASQPYMPYWNEYEDYITLEDYGPEPFVININEATKENNTFRTALWTGDHLQVTLMSIDVGEDIGLEMHPNLDQFIRIEEGEGIVKMGDKKYQLDFQRKVYDDIAFVIPAGTWHNLINTGYQPIKLYSIYAPPQHPRGTVHRTKADAEAAEENHGY